MNKEVPKLTYGEYLRVSDLVSLQHPQSSPPHHDELLFIIIHQTYELWFKQLLHELDAVIVNIRKGASNKESKDDIYEAARLLRRCTEIGRVLVEQFTILETMLPTHFLAFRDKLRPASGFQSEQFRELEFLCGMKDEKMLQHHEPSKDMYSRMERRLKEPSLRDVFFDALLSLGFMKQPPVDATDEEKLHARAEGIAAIYNDERRNRDWIDVCERLTEFDELFQTWRWRHIQMIERIIGTKMGTGGSAGASYLKMTLTKKFLPELWAARSLLIAEDQH